MLNMGAPALHKQRACTDHEQGVALRRCRDRCSVIVG
jgi:hypothetical protein